MQSQQVVPVDPANEVACTVSKGEEVAAPPRPKVKVARMQSIKLDDKVAEGGFAAVHTAEYRGTKMAVKRARSMWIKDAAAVEQMQKEMEHESNILTSLNHPNILKCEGMVQGADRPSLLMEKVEGRTLQQMLHEAGESFGTPEEVLDVLAPLADAMAYLHARGLVHRDLKSPNIMITSEGRTVKLLDFGLARAVPSDGRMTPRTGSLRYAAPEVLRGEPYGFPADVYSFGCLAFEVVAGRVPFSGVAPEQAAAAAAAGARPCPTMMPTRNCTRDMGEAIMACWAERPEQRPTFAQLAMRLAAIASERKQLRASSKANCKCTLM